MKGCVKTIIFRSGKFKYCFSQMCLNPIKMASRWAKLDNALTRSSKDFIQPLLPAKLSCLRAQSQLCVIAKHQGLQKNQNPCFISEVTSNNR